MCKEIKCCYCGKSPNEIEEYIGYSKDSNCTPEEYVINCDGTYNNRTGEFACTHCYIKHGMPLGKAPFNNVLVTPEEYMSSKINNIVSVKPGDTFKTDDGNILFVGFEEDNNENRFIVITSLTSGTIMSYHDKGNTNENIQDAVGFLNFMKCEKVKLNIDVDSEIVATPVVSDKLLKDRKLQEF